MSLKAVVGQKIKETVFRSCGGSSNTASKASGPNWRVLVVDSLGMRMVSTCCKMHELTEMGIALVEDINKSRQPLPYMDAVYLVQPSERSINGIIGDFTSPTRPMYGAAHIYFTEPCPEHCYHLLVNSSISKSVKALTEINIAFLPLEAQVFSLDYDRVFPDYFVSQQKGGRAAMVDQIAQQVATLCATLGEYPSVRYRGDSSLNFDLSLAVQRFLDSHKAEELSMGRSPENARSQLLILDRGFDLISPLLHELTLQAMAYDLLPIENDVYKYETSSGDCVKEVVLDENDNFWLEMRHEHIAKVLEQVKNQMKSFVDSKRGISTDKASIRDLGQMIKKMPQHQKELSKCSAHLNLTEECMNVYNKNVKDLCKTEQDMVMGTDSKGEKIRDYMRPLLGAITKDNLSPDDQIRLLLIYILVKNGITQESMDKLANLINLSAEHRAIINNISHLGHNVFVDGSRKKMYQVPRKERITEETYQMSRWTPVIKDIIEDVIDHKLDERHFPFLENRTSGGAGFPGSGGGAGGGAGGGGASTARYGRWHKGQGTPNVKNVPRLIVFIVGGVTYSEMRVAYEVTNALKNWEVVIGSDQIITPKQFLKNLSKFSQQ